MTSFRCYDNSDVIATLIITNFRLYLIQLWSQFFQIFVCGDVVYAQTWEILTLKNCIEPPLSYDISISKSTRRTNLSVSLALMLMLPQFSLAYTCACSCIAYSYQSKKKNINKTLLCTYFMRMTAHVFWSDFFAAASRLKPGFHLIATIVAIAEKRKVQRSQ